MKRGNIKTLACMMASTSNNGVLFLGALLLAPPQLCRPIPSWSYERPDNYQGCILNNANHTSTATAAAGCKLPRSPLLPSTCQTTN
jgi:hypothetical protein